MTIGIYVVSSQSGRAYFADLIARGYNVCGYARQSEHGKEFVNAVKDLDGIFLDRPLNDNGEMKKFINLGENVLTHDLKFLVDNSDYIIFSEPSIYFVESVEQLKSAGLLKKRPPLILSPSRSFSTPYLWAQLGQDYPIVGFSTCPYSCKAPRPDTSYIKRRKRNWTASLEGQFTLSQVTELGQLFPQAIFNGKPITTNIGNIGAVFHPTTFLMNYDAICKRKADGKIFSFYVEGIAERPEVGAMLESIDQLRLSIADRLDFKTFGLNGNNDDAEWAEIMDKISLNESGKKDLLYLRKIRRDGLEQLKNAIPSCRHWLDYTYAVKYIPCETLSEAIGRTPSYQKNSVPQQRYIDEDLATGLIPLLAFAERIGLKNSAGVETIKKVLAMCEKIYSNRPKKYDRTLKEFSDEYLIAYLKGEFFSISD